ncbi:MAG: extracellular solute-binding protein [Clostridiales bacterium]|nr:extracellular solute-binding protein [Clostridiales bacterium]
MLKKWLCLLLACMMCMTAVFALGEETDSQEEKMVLAGPDDTQYRDWENHVFFEHMYQKTGVSFTAKQYQSLNAWNNMKATYTANSDLPDVFFKAGLTRAEGERMLDEGIIIDLAPYLESCCPNLWAILQANPDYLAAITLPDGRIPSLPYIDEIPTQNVMWINGAFLEEVGMDAPTTADELVKVLEAFRDKDPNKTGTKDEIPLLFLGAFDLKFLGHAFGLIANDYNIFADGDTVRFMPLEDNFRLFITWCRDLYEAGLLHEDGFTTNDTLRRVTDEDSKKQYGMVFAPSVGNLVPASWAEEYDVLMPLSYNGKSVYRDFAGKVINGTFAVTTQCKDVEAALKWADYLYTEEGSVLTVMGAENEDYVVDSDGTWRLTESASNNTYFTVSRIITSSQYCPGIAVHDFQSRYVKAILKEVTDQLRAFNEVCVSPFPAYSLTQAQKDEITPLQNAIGYYVDEQIGRWVLGEDELSDESFAAFESKLYELGLERFMAFWQNVLDNL